VNDLMVVAAPDGSEVGRVPALRPLTGSRARLRALQRKAARQQGRYDPAAKRKQSPSNRWRRTQTRIGKTHARVANLRRDALHKATTAIAAVPQGTAA
jgi:putative transposase